MRWHEAALERHAAELEGLQATAHQLAERLGGSSSAAAGGGGGGEAPAAFAAPPDASPLDHAWSGSGETHPPVTGRAVMDLQLQRGTPSELEEVEARASDEAEWGAVLQASGGRCRWRMSGAVWQPGSAPSMLAAHTCVAVPAAGGAGGAAGRAAPHLGGGGTPHWRAAVQPRRL